MSLKICPKMGRGKIWFRIRHLDFLGISNVNVRSVSSERRLE